MLWLLLACAKPAAVTNVADSHPRVPAPQSPTYAHTVVHPADTLVAKAWPDGLDESLCGAAAALGMQLQSGKALDPAELRWRAVLAGYPWPVREMHTQHMAEDQVPQELLATAQAHVGEDVGLVRTRDRGGDQWVFLLGARRGTLPAFPREPRLSDVLTFPGAEVTAVTPSGETRVYQERLQVDLAGEWLIDLRDAQGEITTFPLYVGRLTPQAPPFAGAASAEAAGDLDEELLLRLDTLDAWYKREPAERDPALDAVARARLRAFVAGQPLPDAGKQLAAAGYFDATAGVCRARSIADCLDVMWWSTNGHAALATRWRTMGMAAVPTADGVAVVVAGADHDTSPQLSP